MIVGWRTLGDSFYLYLTHFCLHSIHKRFETVAKGMTEVVRIKYTGNERTGYPWRFRYCVWSLPSCMLALQH